MESVWSESCKLEKRESLNKDIKTDILIIGAGVAGLVTAYLLKEQGKDVVLIDKGRIAGGNTKNTTAKVTSQHDLIYHKLISEFGEEKARQYAKANELAIKKYKELIEGKKIDCDFEEKAAYVYSVDKVDVIKEEVEAANKLGINAEFVENLDLPFNVKGAIKFNNQGQVNPLKLLKSISEDLTIYENTRALEVKENLVVTDKGEITANHIVVATHYPIIKTEGGYHFLQMHQERSYVLALEGAGDIDGMYIDANKKGYSFRTYKDLLLLGGIRQRTGENKEGGSYDALRKVAKDLFPEAREKYHWSAQDCMTVDGIPYIGKASDEMSNVYAITGFNKWGMTSAMVAAMIISDMILGKENEFSEIFSPKRFDFTASVKNMTKDMSKLAKNLITKKISISSGDIEHIKNGDAEIIEYNGEKVGVYKDADGKAFIVSAICTHMGCELQWNRDELTWDCPCHGSRFDYEGKVINSPTTKDISEEK